VALNTKNVNPARQMNVQVVTLQVLEHLIEFWFYFCLMITCGVMIGWESYDWEELDTFEYASMLCLF